MTRRIRRSRPRTSPALLEDLECRTLFSVAINPLGPDLAEQIVSAPRTAHAAPGKTHTLVLQAATGALVTGDGATGLPGDVNGDGIVDISDLSYVTSHWQQHVTPGSEGDLNGNGIIDIFDLNMVTSNWQRQAAPIAAPLAASYNWQTQVINGVLNVWAPNPSDFGGTWTASSPNALFGTAGTPSITAIQQGQTADCYFLSAIGSMALTHPATIMQDVQNDPGGGWMVTFQYTNSSGATVPIIFHTDDELSSVWQTQADGQVWPLVMEKAFAAFRTWNGSTSTDTMASLDLGYPSVALSQINEANQAIYIAAQSQQAIYGIIASNVAVGHPVLFQTSANAPDMVQSHVYVITGEYTDANGVPWVTTYNPWGFYDTRTEADLLQNGIGQLSVGMA